MTDFEFADHGSVTILIPMNDEAKRWCGEHLPEDAMRWGHGYVIEPRCAGDILEGLAEEGLTVHI